MNIEFMVCLFLVGAQVNISLVVDDEGAKEVVRNLHREFFETQEARTSQNQPRANGVLLVEN